MNKFYLEISQVGLELKVDKETPLYEFSGNVPIKITKDPLYKDWAIVPYIVQNSMPTLNGVVCKNGYPLPYDEASGTVFLPAEAFRQSGYLFISISLTDMTTSPATVLYSGTCRVAITRTISGEGTLSESTVWEQAVTTYVDKYMASHYKTVYDDLVKKATQLEQDAQGLHTTVTQQQASINKAIQDYTTLNTKTTELQAKVTQQQTSIDNANKNYNTMKTDLEKKLSDGFFDGKTILNGQGVPSPTLGRVGDFYINTLNSGEHPYGIFLKEASGWVYKWKTQGVDGTDTLPIQGTLLLPPTQPIPAGYEEVNASQYQLSADYVGSDVDNKSLKVRLGDINKRPNQLLVNNSFQINQRGQTQYVNNTSTPKYTVDMWRLTFGTLNFLENGVQIIPSNTNVYFDQKIEHDLTNKNFVLILKEINGTQHILKGVGSQTNIISNKSGNITLQVSYFSDTRLYKISIIADSSVSIEYIDLFEGDIAYPHVKNPYREDFLDCLQYFVNERYAIVCGGLYKNWLEQKGNGLIKDIGLPVPMKSKNPTSIVSIRKLYCNDGDDDYMPEQLDVVLIISQTVGNGAFVRIQKKDKSAFVYDSYDFVNLKFEISCEPL